MRELSPQYDPKEVEERWYKDWEAKGYFKADPQSVRPPFSIVIPPPNVTGSLHIGHALNNSLQDLLARWKRMQGFDVLWVPGCDHAGISTQIVVEKALAKEGKKRSDLGREAFLERVWKWKHESGSTIMRQLRRLGASCDWSHERFTMDEGLSNSVLEAFVTLYDKGLIYQGDYIVNWCPRCGTALSDIEAIHKESDGKLWHIKYPVAGQAGKFIVVATTRPETIMGDVAVCVNPKDPRFTALKGAKLVLPLMNREIPLIEDRYVDMEFGTGALKITPAHDANDFEIGNKFGLERIKIMDTEGVMNEAAGPYRGLDRFAARKKVVADLETAGLIDKIEDYKHAVARCERCDTVIESYLSLQWYMKMKPMAQKALAAIEEGGTVFQPENWKKVYSDWLLNIRDWCISRQIWWGHRIPIYYNADKSKQCAARSLAEAAQKLGLKESEISQDPDVLDTWFSAGLWPFSTLGWPGKTQDLERYYPTSALVTSWDILFFWVARMSMFGLELMGKVPFKEVWINSLVADEHGKKMSKSKGNGIDPLDEIDEIGADALRFALFSVETRTRYISLSQERLDNGRNFMNKIWNASRFILGNLEGMPSGPLLRPDDKMSGLSDRWVLDCLDETVRRVNVFLDERSVNHAANCIYDFFWGEFCGWYIEAAKVSLQSADPNVKAATQRTLAFVLEKTLRLLHPFCPFITEEIWQLMPHQGQSIMQAEWPNEPKEGRENSTFAETQREFGVITTAVYMGRNVRGEKKVDLKKKIKVIFVAERPEQRELLKQHKVLLQSLGNLDVLDIVEKAEKPKNSVEQVLDSLQAFFPLEGLVDLEAERQKNLKEIENFMKLIGGVERKLGNEAFVSKAPAAVVEAERNKIAEYKLAIEKLKLGV